MTNPCSRVSCYPGKQHSQHQAFAPQALLWIGSPLWSLQQRLARLLLLRCNHTIKVRIVDQWSVAFSILCAPRHCLFLATSCGQVSMSPLRPPASPPNHSGWSNWHRGARMHVLDALACPVQSRMCPPRLCPLLSLPNLADIFLEALVANFLFLGPARLASP